MKKILLLLLFPFSLFAQDGLKTLIATGSSNAYLISESLPSNYDQKERFQIIFPSTNTGAATLKRAGLAVKNIKKPDGTALSSGDLVAGSPYLISYNSSAGYYICETCSGSGGGGTVAHANNGLSLSGDTVQLGDQLTKDTDITGQNYKLRFGLDGLGLYQIAMQSGTNAGSSSVVVLNPINFDLSNYYGISSTKFNAIDGTSTGLNLASVGGVFTIQTDTTSGGGVTRFSIDDLGNIKITPNGIAGTNGKVLTSDAYGNASWQSTNYIKSDGSIPLTANWNVGGFKLINLVDPTSAQDAATKAYVDAVAQGLVIKTSVRIATTDTLPANTYNNGASGVGATLTANVNGVLTIDGVTPSLNDRLLIKDETNHAHNGIYTLTTLGTVSVPYVLTRATDNDQASEMPSAFVFVQDGTINSSSGWVVIGSSFTIGTTDIYWTQFNGTNVTAGTGLTLTGTTLSVNTSQNITTLSNLTTKGIVKTTDAGLLGSQQGTGYLKDDGSGNITYDNSTFLTSYTETDPIYSASSWFGTTNNSTNWDAAYAKRLSSASLSTSTLTLTLADATTVTASVPTWNQNTTGTSLNITASSNTSLTSLANLATVGTLIAGSYQANPIADAYISSATNWNTAYTNRITSLTTTGSSGAATLSSNILNIPNYTLSGLGGWSLASGGTLTGTNTITSNSLAQLIFTGTATASANNQSWTAFTPTLTSRSTASDAIQGVTIGGSLIAASTGIVASPLYINTTLKTNSGITTGSSGTQTGSGNGGAISSSVAGMTATTYTNIAPASTSGTGTGALFTVVVASATTFTSITCTTSGSGYSIGETLTFNGSQFGSGSGSITIAILSTANTVSANAAPIVVNTGFPDYVGLSTPIFTAISPVTGNKVFGISALNTASSSLTQNQPNLYLADGTGTFINTNPNNIILGRNLSMTGFSVTASGITSNTSLSVSSGSTFAGTVTQSNNPSSANLSASQTYYNFSGANVGGFAASSLINSKIKIAPTTVRNGIINSFVASGTATNGTYTNVSLSGGTGSGAVAGQVVVTGGSVASASFTAGSGGNRGTNYTKGDVLTGTITGGTVTITLDATTGVDFVGNIEALVYDHSSLTDAKSGNYYYTFYGDDAWSGITSAQAGRTAFVWYQPASLAGGGFSNYSFVANTTGTLGGVGGVPISSWDVAGSVGTGITTSTGSLTLDATHSTVIITSGTGSYTLPSASAATRRIYRIVNQTGSARTISSYKDKSNASQTTVGANAALMIQSDGSNWYQIN